MSIGFNYAGKHLPEVIDKNEDEVIPLVDDIEPEQRAALVANLLKQEGMVKAITILNEYFSSSYLPLMRGGERDIMYIAKLRKIKERYFEPI